MTKVTSHVNKPHTMKIKRWTDSLREAEYGTISNSEFVTYPIARTGPAHLDMADFPPSLRG